MKMLPTYRRPACALVAALMLTFIPALVAPARAQQAPLQDKPFAEHKIVLQLSDNDPKRQALVISVAYNLLKFYYPAKVASVVVTFGPGIVLLRTDNGNRKLVESLIRLCVRFVLCFYTCHTLSR